MTNIPELIKICDEATPGPWYCYSYDDDNNPNPINRIHYGSCRDVFAENGVDTFKHRDENSVFIATFNPSFVKQLLTRLQDYEETLESICYGYNGMHDGEHVCRVKAKKVLDKYEAV